MIYATIYLVIFAFCMGYLAHALYGEGWEKKK